MLRVRLASLCFLLLLATYQNAGTKVRIYDVGGDVKAPVRIKDCKPVFPESLAGKRMRQPRFVYEMVISARGRVESLRRVKGPSGEPYSAIDQAFRESIRCWRFKPATLHGRPVACKYMMTATAEVR